MRFQFTWSSYSTTLQNARPWSSRAMPAFGRSCPTTSRLPASSLEPWELTMTWEAIDGNCMKLLDDCGKWRRNFVAFPMYYADLNHSYVTIYINLPEGIDGKLNN